MKSVAPKLMIAASILEKREFGYPVRSAKPLKWFG